jgi:hypothetical protein
MRRLAAVLAVTLALLASAPWASAAAPELRPVPLEALRGGIEGRGQFTLGEHRLDLEVNGYALVALPFAAQEVEVEVEARGPVLVSWGTRAGNRVRVYGPPWRYAPVPPSRATMPIDLRTGDGWTPSAQPVLMFLGGGTVVVHALRARPAPADPDEARAGYDRALLWAPESVGHTTINLLTPSFWRASRGTWLADVVAGAALVVFAGMLAGVRLRQGRLRPGLALAAAGAFALAAWNTHFLVRFLPMANLSLELDPEERIRDNHYVNPEVGALAALARATLRPDERVGTMGRPNDWFGPQTLCFNLAPRRCAILRTGETEHRGISGVGRLRDDEIDAIVSIGVSLPDGFVPVASVSPRAVVARRR